MRKFILALSLIVGLSITASTQPTDYNGGRQDPNQVKTYRADVGINGMNLEAPGLSPQASNIILKANTNCEIVVSVQSNSELLLEGYRLTLTVDGKPVASLKQDGLRPHEAVTHRIRYNANVAGGNHSMVAKIDPVPLASMPGEDNPRNNQATLAFTVEGQGGGAGAGSGPADLVVDHISPSELESTDKVIIEIAIGNQGGADVSGSVELDIVIAGQSRRAFTSTGVPAGKTAFASIELPLAVWKRNPHGKVTIDPGNQVRESNKGNNTKTF